MMMRTPKFNQTDVEEIKLLLENNDTKVVAKLVGCSYLTMLKIKQGTYRARTDERRAFVPTE
jgi:hypothetical protein